MHVTVNVRDVPGALAEVTTRIGETGASIAQVAHQRTFSHLSLELVKVEFVLHTRGLDHVHEVITTLENAGYHVSATDINSNR